MTVREFLKLWADNVTIKVYQRPIWKIDKNSSLVHRQTANIDTMINSNQNFLDFEIENLQMDQDLIIVVCKANKEQEEKTIAAYNSGKWR